MLALYPVQNAANTDLKENFASKMINNYLSFISSTYFYNSF